MGGSMGRVKNKETEGQRPAEGRPIKPTISVDIDPLSHLLDFDPDQDKIKDKTKKTSEKDTYS
jgi:hypothetical protein